MTTQDLLQTLRRLAGAPGAAWHQSAIDAVADRFAARTATLHRAEAGGGVLHLLACRGIPETILPVTRSIPFGKGMAGICAERRAPVTVCNLQTDASGVARPSARETGVAGAIVVPILAADGSVAGTLGVGKDGEHEYTAAEIECLESAARILSEALAR